MVLSKDVNEELEAALALASKLKTLGASKISTRDAELLAERVLSLHEHLSTGGELPQRWKRPVDAVGRVLKR